MTSAIAQFSECTPQGSEDRARDALAALEPSERLRAAFEQHFALVWRSLRRFGVAEGRVDDAVQHVFLTFSARLPKVPRASERAFLLSTAVRVAANTRRLDARSREVPSDQLEAVGDDCHTPEQLLDWKQRREALDRALDLLPLEQRAVFVLYELEGFSLPEIAHNLGIRLGTATSRLRRARARFEVLADGFDLPETGDE
jgi:RNA polymerase sigma-70 factor (ECF subfamily)